MWFGSLFTGIGGFDLGFERAGMQCAWQVEIDNAATKILERHWPGVQRYRDVRGCGRHNLAPVDLVCGGFPCTDVSVAGRRAGLAGKQSGLWFEFHRILEELRPGWVIIENVPGLLSSAGGRDFATILQGLAECGYLAAWRVLDAQYFGLAQRRHRVFLVASLGDGRATQVLFECEGMPGDTQACREAGQEVAAMSDRGTDGRGGYNDMNRCGVFVPYGLDSRNNRLDGESQTFVVGSLQAHSERHGHAMSTQQAAEAGQLLAYNWQSGGDVRLSLGLPNLSANQVPAVGVRRLTPIECERLMGFPDGFTDRQSDSARYRQLGNSVAIPVVEWIGRRIMKVMGYE